MGNAGASVVHFKTGSSAECRTISPFLDTLCTRYPSINFLKVRCSQEGCLPCFSIFYLCFSEFSQYIYELKVDIEDSPAIGHSENVRVVPTFKIYRKGVRVKEMICPSPEVLESSVRHYNI